jgi:hypothetical protein
MRNDHPILERESWAISWEREEMPESRPVATDLMGGAAEASGPSGAQLGRHTKEYATLWIQYRNGSPDCRFQRPWAEP